MKHLISLHNTILNHVNATYPKPYTEDIRNSMMVDAFLAEQMNLLCEQISKVDSTEFDLTQLHDLFHQVGMNDTILLDPESYMESTVVIAVMRSIMAVNGITADYSKLHSWENFTPFQEVILKI